VNPPRKGLAIASLALGMAGLLSGGCCGLGALVGIALGIAALTKASRAPAQYGGRDVAWAGIVSNALGLLSLIPLALLAVFLQQSRLAPDLPFGDNETPELAVAVPDTEPAAAMPPPPPPPPARPTTTVTPPAPSAPENGEPTAPSLPEAPPPQEAIRVGGAIREPTRLKSVAPVYPAIARQARVQGVVILECTIGPDGHVKDVRVLRSIPLLDAAAVEAVQQWVYTPTLLNGVPVPVIMTVTVNFTLS
jgi:TonB family protein